MKLVIAGAAMFATLGLIAGSVRDVQPQHQGQDRGPRAARHRPVGHQEGKSKRRTHHVRFEPQLWRKGEHLPYRTGHRGGMLDDAATAWEMLCGQCGMCWW